MASEWLEIKRFQATSYFTIKFWVVMATP